MGGNADGERKVKGDGCVGRREGKTWPVEEELRTLRMHQAPTGGESRQLDISELSRMLLSPDKR